MLTSNEIIHITKEVALGIPPTLTSQEALNCRAITDQEKKMIEERGHLMDIPDEWPSLD